MIGASQSVDAAGEAMLCRAFGSEEIICAACAVLLAVLLPPAWVTAAPWLASPAGLVVSAGSLNGVTCVAAAEPLA